MPASAETTTRYSRAAHACRLEATEIDHAGRTPAPALIHVSRRSDATMRRVACSKQHQCSRAPAVRDRAAIGGGWHGEHGARPASTVMIEMMNTQLIIGGGGRRAISAMLPDCHSRKFVVIGAINHGEIVATGHRPLTIPARRRADTRAGRRQSPCRFGGWHISSASTEILTRPGASCRRQNAPY